MTLLALDTSTEACSAALLCDDGELFSEFDITPRRHTSELPKMLDAVLQKAKLKRSQITHCAFANGPGAFTGIRIGAATAQGIAMGLNVPLLSISTLAALAQEASSRYDINNVLVALDARMGEVYTALYVVDENSKLVRLQHQEQLLKLQSSKMAEGVNCGVGHGWSAAIESEVNWGQSESMLLYPNLLPSAAAVARLAQEEIFRGHKSAAENISINYLRNQVAKKAAPKRL